MIAAPHPPIPTTTSYCDNENNVSDEIAANSLLGKILRSTLMYVCDGPLHLAVICLHRTAASSHGQATNTLCSAGLSGKASGRQQLRTIHLKSK